MLSEFKTFGNAQRALDIVTGKDWKLKGRHALTPRHLHAWLRGLPSESRSPELQVISPLSEKQTLQVSKYILGRSWGEGEVVGRGEQLWFVDSGPWILSLENSHESSDQQHIFLPDHSYFFHTC